MQVCTHKHIHTQSQRHRDTETRRDREKETRQLLPMIMVFWLPWKESRDRYLELFDVRLNGVDVSAERQVPEPVQLLLRLS